MSLPTRIFSLVTLLACLLVGAASVRLMMAQNSIVTLDTKYIDSLNSIRFVAPVTEKVKSPELAFSEIKFPAVKKVIIVKKVPREIPQQAVAAETKVAKSELNFREPVTLTKVSFENTIVADHLALYKPFEFENVSDEVKTKLAQSSKVSEDEELDAMFFEYPTEKTKPQSDVAGVATTAEVIDEVKDVKDSPEEDSAEVAGAINSDYAKDVVDAPASAEKATEEEYFDYAAAAVTEPGKAEVIASPSASPAVAPAPTITGGNLTAIQLQERKAISPPVSEVVSMDQMMAFDYSSANKDVKTGKIPKVSRATKPNVEKNNLLVDPSGDKSSALIDESLTSQKMMKTATTYQARVSIQVTSTNLKEPQNESGFQVRFQDDLSSMLEDYGSGTVHINESLAQKSMTRTVTVLKRGYTPTSNDLIIESGETTLSLPLIDEEVFNTLMEPFGSRGSVGALLVEMDDSTHDAVVDVPVGKVMTLDGDLRETTTEDYRYKLFLGVRAGNVLVSFQTNDRQEVSKILHVHENEVTFDANLYDDVREKRLSLKEEDLLSKERAPLITSASSVKVFASNRESKKINDHTYSLDFGKGSLGGRQYVELSHQSEPIFVGFKDNKDISVPSENFMRHILSNIDGGSLAQHCVVQVNLSKKLSKAFVSSESVNDTVLTYTQMLDADGKFYDSASSKTRKVIVVGQYQGTNEQSGDARMNIKLDYVDGTSEYVGSYCSPNTYLVEQL